MSAALALPYDDPRRADGPAMLGIPPRQPVGAAAPDGDAGEFSARDVLNALRYHLVLFLFLGTLAAAGLAFAAWTFFPAKYTTYSMLRAFSNEQTIADRNVNGVSKTEFGTYLSTQAAVIKSHKNMNAALGQIVAGGRTLRQLPMFEGLDDPIAFLEEKVLVEFSDHSEIMKVSMTGDDPDQITATANAVTNAFMNEVRASKQYKQRQYDALLRVKNDQERSVKELTKAYQEQFMAPAGNDAKVQGKKKRLGDYFQLQSQEAHLRTDLQKAREQLANAQTRAQQIEKEEIVIPELASHIENDPAVYRKSHDVIRIENYIAYYERTSNRIDHDHLGKYQRDLKREQAALEELKKQTRARLTQAYLMQQTGGQGGKLEVLKLQKDVERLQIEQRLNREELAKYADLEREEAQTGPPPEQTAMQITLRTNQERLAQLTVLADQQRDELKAEDRVQLYEPAHVPQQREMKKQLAFTGVGALGGYFLVGGLITLSETRRKRVYSHVDPVFKKLNVLGRIPESGFVAPAAGADPATDDPNGRMFREAIDRVKTLTVQQMSRRKMRSVLVMSPGADEGKSILAWNLAASMARTDFRVLFVDANLTHPSIHEHLEVANSEGFAEVLRGDRALLDVVAPTPVANLFCLPAGNPDNFARRLLDTPALTKVLDKARTAYDFVVLDSCALGEAVDPLCLAQRVDAVMLSMRTYKSRVPAAETAARQVQTLGTPLLGIVLTDATLTAGEV